MCQWTEHTNCNTEYHQYACLLTPNTDAQAPPRGRSLSSTGRPTAWSWIKQKYFYSHNVHEYNFDVLALYFSTSIFCYWTLYYSSERSTCFTTLHLTIIFSFWPLICDLCPCKSNVWAVYVWIFLSCYQFSLLISHGFISIQLFDAQRGKWCNILLKQQLLEKI